MLKKDCNINFIETMRDKKHITKNKINHCDKRNWIDQGA